MGNKYSYEALQLEQRTRAEVDGQLSGGLQAQFNVFKAM